MNVTVGATNLTSFANETDLEEEVHEQNAIGINDYVVLFYGWIALIPNSLLLYVIIRNKLQKKISYLYVAVGTDGLTQKLPNQDRCVDRVRSFTTEVGPAETLGRTMERLLTFE
uniref:Uncharacterized protein n=1 Tax=Trichuris muris TaxID=70415 RepID=A0A5S6QCK5_TRIMR